MLTSPDGAYFKVEGHKAQIVVVVGRMHFAPVEYQNPLRYETDKWFCLESAAFLLGPPGDPRKSVDVLLLRGVVSMMFSIESVTLKSVE